MRFTRYVLASLPLAALACAPPLALQGDATSVHRAPPQPAIPAAAAPPPAGEPPPPVAIHVVHLNHTPSDEMARTLMSLTHRPRPPRAHGPGGNVRPPRQLFAGHVRVAAHRRPNALVIIANADDFTRLQQVIGELDIPLRHGSARLAPPLEQ